MRNVLALLVLLASAPAWAKAPKLVLFISVDGMGSELFLRMRPKMKAGLAQLASGGAYFPSAKFEYTKTATAPGHATLSTGANPWRHGIIGNRGFNRAQNKLEPVFADASHPALEAPPAIEDVSPENLRAETLADRLRISTYGQGKAIAISNKARASIALAGRLGQAWWFHEGIGKFVSGTYYVKEFPEWLTAFNAKKLPETYFGKEWQPLLAATEYPGEDDQPAEADILGLGRTFPHSITGGLPGPGAQFYAALSRSPYMNELLIQAAKAAIEGEKLGKDDAPDLLAVSFTAIDRLNHLYGPYSWEAQDAMLRLDRALSELLTAAERAAGSKANLLVILSADHGCAALPETWASMGIQTGRMNPTTLTQQLNAALKPKFGFDPVAAIDDDGVDVYLDAKQIADKKADGAAIRRATADWLRAQPQVALAVAKDDLHMTGAGAGLVPTLQKGFHPESSGDVLFVAKPFQVVDRETGGTNHGSPYSYDSVVPVIFAGRGIKPGVYSQQISPADVAPTASFLLEMSPPAQSEGQVRSEIMTNGRAP